MFDSKKDNSFYERNNSTTTFPIQENCLINPKRLDGTNYIEWSLNAQNKIHGRKRSGTKVPPKDELSEEYES